VAHLSITKSGKVRLLHGERATLLGDSPFSKKAISKNDKKGRRGEEADEGKAIVNESRFR